jgi:hypothetical protein
MFYFYAYQTGHLSQAKFKKGLKLKTLPTGFTFQMRLSQLGRENSRM